MKEISHLIYPSSKDQYTDYTQTLKYVCNALYGDRVIECKRTEIVYAPNNPSIKKVVFNNPATIVMWADGTKTVVKCGKDEWDPEKGLAMAIAKKMLGNEGNYYETFKKWLPEEEEYDLESAMDMIKDYPKLNFDLS